MDTKWKNLNRPLYLFISLALFMLSIGLIGGYDMSLDEIFESNPLKSRWLDYKFTESYDYLWDLMTNYGSEERILSGASLRDEEVYVTMEELAGETLRQNGYDLLEEDGGLVIKDDMWETVASATFMINGKRIFIIQYSQAGSSESSASAYEYGTSSAQSETAEQGIPQSAQSSDYESAPVQDHPFSGSVTYVAEPVPDDNVLTYSSVYDFIESFRDQARELNISGQLYSFREQLQYINRERGFMYYFYNESGDLITNLDTAFLETGPDGYFRSLPAYYVGSTYNHDSNLSVFSRMNYPELTYSAMGFETELFNSFLAANGTFRYFSTIIFLLFIASGFSVIFFGSIAVFLSGRSFYEDKGNGPVEVKGFSPKKFLYADLALALFIIALAAAVIDIGRSSNVYDFSSFMTVTSVGQAGIILAGTLKALAAAAVMTFSFYSIVFSFRSHELSEHLLILKILTLLFHLTVALAEKGNLRFYLISNKKFDLLLNGMDRILEGDYLSPIVIRGRGKAAKLAERINRISDGFNIAVENRMKSERLKSELISNVSHDIRTPLTSIITYVDLLKKNEATEDERAGYLEVLENKTARLKTLIDDLFDASKASSGNISAEMEILDLHNVMEQAMGEVEDKLEASSLQFILNCPKNSLYIMADGGLLWRVIHNLFSNIFKYSMANSRVYIDVYAEGANVHMTFKNISAYELNISSDELMERFTRGDRSRNSEGSGLGLTIARSLTENMGGSFELELDGDLFKVSLSFPAA